jgi:uncharacterized protein (TIGR03435 family)
MTIPTAQRILARIALLAVLSVPVFAQPPAADPPAATVPASGAASAPPTFDIADVHPSPHSNTPFVRGGDLHGDRFVIRQASMVDLIAKAYGVENANVLRGPAWLDTDRFDIMAKAPRTASPEDIKLMLRALLADRFKLVAHNDTKDLPAFVLSVGKGGPKLKESDGSGPANCNGTPNPPSTPPGAVPLIYVTCKNMTLDQIAQNLRGMAGGYLTNPVVNSTGIQGSWNFDIKWTARGNLQRAGGDGISIFDAVDKQLGLKLEAKTAPLPVVIVASVNQTPTPNPPGLDQALPPLPPAEFDVAILKPSPPDTKGINGRINGGQVNLTGAPLKWLIGWAWDLSDDMIADAPKWLGEDRWDLIAKVVVDPQTAGPTGAPQIEMDDLQQMVKNLLADRFKMQSHMEDRPADAYTLLADSPKLKKADPDNRTGCKEGPGADGKDPRIANPTLGRLLTCQNMTLTQFGELLQIQANGYIHAPVLNATGLTGAYDFTLSFSTAGQLRTPAPPSANNSSDPNAASTAADPSGGLSLFDAMQKQLGIKLEKQKRPIPMLVIDHIEEKPTDN